MEKDQFLRKYELVVITDAKLSAEEKKNVAKEASEVVSKAGGKIINIQLWLEKHKFTFQICKCDEGSYYLITLESDPSFVEKMNAALKLNEKILRFLIIQVESAPLAETAAH